MSKHTYQIAFRGEIIRTITSVYPEIHVVVGFPEPVSTMRVLTWYKTAKSAINDCKARTHSSRLSSVAMHSAFVVPATPGLTDLSACPVIYSTQRLSGREPEVVMA